MGFLDWLLGPPKPEEYARLIQEGLRRAGDSRISVYDAETFSLGFVGSKSVTGLQDIYKEYCSLTRAKRPIHLKQLIRALLAYRKEPPEEFEDARPDLLPVVRSRATHALIRLARQVEGHPDDDTPFQEIGDHLQAGIVYDLPELMRAIHPDKLAGWGVSFYELMEIARSNLEGMQFAMASVGSRVYASVTGDNYDASRLLLTEFIQNLEIDGDPVALVPNRDTLLITGTNDLEGLSLVCDLAEQALEKAHKMNAIPVRLTAGQWETWLPEASHPLAGKFRLLEIKSLNDVYAEQKALLNALYTRDNIARFVASYAARMTSDGQVLSYAIWSQGIESLLPETHLVMFLAGDGADLVACGEWARVRELVGDLMQPQELYPPRYLVTEFPTPEQLAKIGMRPGSLA